MSKGRITPKQAAMVLLRTWLNGGQHPLFMSYEDMQWILSELDYKLTQKRMEEINEQIRKITAPLEERINGYLVSFGLD